MIGCSKLLVLIFILNSPLPVSSQMPGMFKEDMKAGTAYFAFGTNLSFYSGSDIHFKSNGHPSFDFTLFNARAEDDRGIKFNNGGAPQYSYQVGYYNNKKNWGIEFNFDHIKYFMKPFQRLHMKGNINGQLYNTDTVVTPGFVHLEHSDGANYALLKLTRWIPLAHDKHQKNVMNFVIKAGGGPVIPKTNSTIMGRHRDDRYKIAGYVVALEGGLRYNFSKILFAEANAKGAYANYHRFVIADGTGSQKWFGLHFALLLGLQLSK